MTTKADEADRENAVPLDDAKQAAVGDVTQLERKWQGRFDKVLAEKKEVERELEEAKQANTTTNKKEQELDRRERLMTISAENGYELDNVLSVFYAQDPESQMDAFKKAVTIEAEKMLAEEIDKRFPKGGKPPQAGPNDAPELAYTDMLEMTDEQINSLPDSVFNSVTAQPKKTLRDKIRGLI